jgi:hypothetical protein
MTWTFTRVAFFFYTGVTGQRASRARRQDSVVHEVAQERSLDGGGGKDVETSGNESRGCHSPGFARLPVSFVPEPNASVASCLGCLTELVLVYRQLNPSCHSGCQK